jgi:hypothetical protein
VITAWAVWEHLHDPMNAFTWVAKLLRPRGRFICLVPNLRSINSRYARAEDIPRHLYVFSAQTLNEYARRVGLRVSKITHNTDLFGGSGRGVLRLALISAVGKTTDDFYRLLYSTRRSRFRQGPALASVWTAVGLFERIALSDWIIRHLRLSGNVICFMERPR